MKYFLLHQLLYNCVLIFLWTDEVQAQQDDPLADEIHTINREMAQALIEGNSEKSLSYYTDDVISIPNNSDFMVGIDRIRKANTIMIANRIKVTQFDLTTTEIFTCDDLVMETGLYHIVLIVPGMAGAMDDQGKYVTIWERQADGQLKIKIELWSAIDMEKLPSHF